MGARLVRDYIGDTVWRYPDAKQGLRGVNSHAEHLRLLQSKLLEEVGELLAATTKEENFNEAADVLQVIVDLIQVRGYDPPDIGQLDVEILTRARARFTAVGGFEKGTVWEI